MCGRGFADRKPSLNRKPRSAAAQQLIDWLAIRRQITGFRAERTANGPGRVAQRLPRSGTHDSPGQLLDCRWLIANVFAGRKGGLFRV
jgi:hypothetical protein